MLFMKSECSNSLKINYPNIYEKKQKWGVKGSPLNQYLNIYSEADSESFDFS